MKKSYKGLILLGATTFAIASASILHTTNLIGDYKEKIQAYIQNPSSALDNIFTDNNEIIIPFIYNSASEKMTSDRIKAEFKKAGLTVKNISTGTKVGTGTKITVNENSKVYNILVYGDVNGDGDVDLADAQKIILYKKDPVSVKIEGLYYKAANVSNDDKIVDLQDAQRIIMFKRGTLPKRLVVIEPTTTKDKEKPVITLKGNKNDKIEVGTVQKYTDPGATAKDNFDGNMPTNDIKVTGVDKVNTKVVGKYTITYTIVDCHGNKGTTTRTVNVVDTTKPVIKLKGDSTVIIQLNEEYKELGATATDNYDSAASITSKIKTTGIVDSTKAGEYTVYYNVTDTNNNAAVQVERKVIVKDKIDSIVASDIPTVNCNYADKEIDLTGLEITVNWKTSPSTKVAIKNDMIEKDYDLTQVGKQTITVNYEGFKTNFEINVFKPINDIELLENGRENITQIDGGYKANTKQEFTLGTLKELQIENGSTLKEEQINIETKKIELDGTEVETEDILIFTQEDAQGNILLKGSTEHEGKYKVNAYITYADSRVEKSITLQVLKSTKIKSIGLEEIAEDEVRLNQLQTVKKQLIIKNENDENINVTSGDLRIENVSEGISVTRLNADKSIVEGNETKVEYLEIITTLTEKKEVGFTIKIGEFSKDIKFVVGDPLVLSKVEIDADEIELYLEQPKESKYTVKKEENDYYTIVPINFYNQINEKINVPESAIKEVTQGSTTIKDNYLQDENNVVIVVPKASMLIDGEKEQDKVTKKIKFYDENNNVVTGGSYVAKIGIALISDEGIEIELDSLKGKNIQIETQRSTAVRVPIKAQYKEISSLNIDESVSKNVTRQEENENRIVTANKEFVIGKMQVGTYEGPLTPDVLELSVQGMQGKINVEYDIDENNNVIIKGTALDEGNCQITASVKGTQIKAPNIFLKAVSIPEIEKIEIENENEEGIINLEMGKIIEARMKAISSSKPSGEIIKVKDINMEYDESSISIDYLDSGRQYIEKENLDEEVQYIKITNISGAQEGISNIKITLFEGKENQYIETKKIQMYNGIPRTIDIANTVQIYDEKNENTVVNAGKIYTLLPIEAYADEQKTQSVTLTSKLIVKLPKGEENILLTIPKADLQINGEEGQESVSLVDVKYFTSSKTVASTTAEVKYIGIAYSVSEDDYIFDKSNLNNYEVVLKCTNNSKSYPIKLQYAAH